MKTFLLLGVAMLANVAHAGRLAELYQQAHSPKSPPVTITRQYTEPKAHGITEIGLERTRCYGTCPDYTVVIKSNGNVSYNGGMYAPRKGRFTGRVEPWKFDQLARYINEAGFAKFADSYTAGVTDNPTVYTGVVTRGKRKIVSDYAQSGPANLWAIENLLDNLVAQTVWNASPK
jgi:hypothetical protein